MLVWYPYQLALNSNYSNYDASLQNLYFSVQKQAGSCMNSNNVTFIYAIKRLYFFVSGQVSITELCKTLNYNYILKMQT